MRNNIFIELPQNVKLIINKLEAYGYKAYAVGGCVRDSLLGRIPYDWDITTNAIPNEVKKVFKDEKIFETGIKHGTITLVIDGVNYEITTFRTEGEYSDMRHPDCVEFANSIYDDLSRRDFTVNAIAYSHIDGLKCTDGAIKDLQNKIIKTVGDADKRFGEDALRILRALRFSAMLGFKIHPDTEKSILKNFGLLKYVSAERIKTELYKMVCGNNFKYICLSYKNVLNQLLDGADISNLTDSFFENNILYKSEIVFGAFLNLVCNNTGEICNKLKLSNAEKHIVKIGATDYNNNSDKFFVLKLVCDMGENDFLSLLDIWHIMGCDISAYRQIYKEAKNNNVCLDAKCLALKGDEFAKHFTGKDISLAIKNTLYAVVCGDINNTKDDILNYITKLKRF